MTIKGNYRQTSPKLAKACRFKRKFANDYPTGQLGNSDKLSQNYAPPQIVFWIWFIGNVMGWCLICSDALQAQITPDGSLETEVNVADNMTEISGGTRSASNLFHSFQDFSVAIDDTAFFNNAADISNIVGRVTGGNISNIDGLIRANGNANLILINPSGINFGANASLDIGGSFLGSTADSVIFEDGTVFSATDTQVEPMLTISVPIGLQLGQNSQAIQVSGAGNSNSDFEENPSLAVTPGNTFAIVGNGITFNGGVVTAESGRIELGSVAEGEVSISEVNAGWQLGYEAVTELNDLQFLAASSLENPNLVNNPDGGIQIQGKNITLERSQITAPTLGDSPGADININASESLSLYSEIEDGTISSSQILNEVSPEASGNGGAIKIETGSLNISDRSFISNTTFGTGDGGTLTINANQSIELMGITNHNGMNQGGLFATSGRANFPDVSTTGTSGDIAIITGELIVRDGATINVQSLGTGDSGNLDIAADSILLDNHGNLAAATQSGAGGNIEIKSNTLKIDRGLINASVFESGTGGNIEIEARNSVEVIGSGFDSLQRLFFAQSFPDLESLANFEFGLINEGIIAATTGKANAGTISIETGNLQIREGGLVATATAGDGIAGSIFLNASESLKVDASIVSSSSLFTGQGGDILINTENLEALAGAQITTSTLGSGNSGSLTIDATESITVAGVSTSNIFSNISVGAEPLPTTTGNGGDLTITTTKLNINDGGIVSVNSTGTGDAGTLGVNADSILLNRRGAITADTQSGGGGNVFLDAENIILRGNSNTSARAVGVGDGGNITINTNNIVALESSQITADAIQGMGGNIQIDTQGLFVCGECQISASSRLGIDGQVNIETLQPDPQLEIVDVPQQPAQAKEEVTVACPREGNNNTSELTITGRGGLPPRPQEPLSEESIIAFDTSVGRVKQSTNSTTKSLAALPPPARGWYRTPQGRVVLTAQVTGTVDNNSTLTALDCHAQ